LAIQKVQNEQKKTTFLGKKKEKKNKISIDFKDEKKDKIY
jgi:hypothetical protein